MLFVKRDFQSFCADSTTRGCGDKKLWVKNHKKGVEKNLSRLVFHFGLKVKAVNYVILELWNCQNTLKNVVFENI